MALFIDKKETFEDLLKAQLLTQMIELGFDCD